MSQNLDRDSTVEKVLRISFNARDDVFQLSSKVISPANAPTKRNVLSTISKLFDPMGFVGPVTMKAIIFLQELWHRNLDWDTLLPADLERIWSEFYTKIVTMPDIPRYVQIYKADQIQLVGFCDASAVGYGCCLYIKVKKGDECHVHLLCSKSRLNGTNSKLTIPKLELNGSLCWLN